MVWVFVILGVRRDAMSEDLPKQREVSIERDVRSPEEYRAMPPKKTPYSAKDNRSRDLREPVPPSSSVRGQAPSNDAYYQDYYNNPQTQQYYEYYQQRDWGYGTYNNGSYERGYQTSSDRNYNYEYGSNSHDQRPSATNDAAFYSKGKDDNRNFKYPDNAGHRQFNQDRDTWSTPAEKGPRNRDYYQSGGNYSGPARKYKDNPPSLRTPH